MRDDALGFFWEDLQTKAGRSTYARVIPAIPETGWAAPAEFPRLADAPVIALDTETRDPLLREKGPGFRRSGEEGAEVVGIAVGTPDGGRWYFPMRHTIAPEQNMDPGHVLAWARDNLCTEGQTKIGANLMYDVDALWSEGVPVTGPFIDVQFAEALLDENRFTYALDALLKDYFGTGKVKDELRDWVERAYGDAESYRANIWRAPPCLVGPYAEGDVDGPLRLWAEQQKRLAAEDLTDLFALESDLIEPLVCMRHRGVRVDVEGAKRLDAELTAAIDLLDSQLAAVAGRPVSTTTADDLKRLFDAAGVPYPLTPKTKQPSFTKQFLESCEHPAAMLVVERRKLAKYRDTFVRGYVLDLNVNGRLHALFHPLRGDENGTVSGRFSSSLPNLQNIPVRDPVWGPKLRALFLPEEGEVWGRHDWSQIEYRFLAHYARGPSGHVVRQRYNDDPDTDFHELTLDMVAPVAGWDIADPGARKQHRRPIKGINFGLTYGMGKKKLTTSLGLDAAAGNDLFDAYHKAVPFVRDTYDDVSQRAKSRGWIKTALNRRARFTLWEPLYSDRDEDKALPYAQALDAYNGRIVRAYTHKALNRLLQGSAADLMKKAMRDMWRAGVHRELGQMLLTCHDETGHSVPQTPAGREAMDEVKHIMETCMTLRVPIIADQSAGPNWGACA